MVRSFNKVYQSQPACGQALATFETLLPPDAKLLTIFHPRISLFPISISAFQLASYHPAVELADLDKTLTLFLHPSDRHVRGSLVIRHLGVYSWSIYRGAHLSYFP